VLLPVWSSFSKNFQMKQVYATQNTSVHPEHLKV
jgi:hypothetical protein